jgi:hypothetical protein
MQFLWKEAFESTKVNIYKLLFRVFLTYNTETRVLNTEIKYKLKCDKDGFSQTISAMFKIE